MRHRIHAGGGRHGGGHGHRQIGIDHRQIGQHVARLHGEFVFGGRVGDQRARARLAAGAGGGRHLHQPRPTPQHLLGADNIVECLAGAGQHRGELGQIHRGPAAKADHHLRLGGFRQSEQGVQIGNIRLRLHPPEHRGMAGQIEQRHTGGVEGIGDDQNPGDAQSAGIGTNLAHQPAAEQQALRAENFDWGGEAHAASPCNRRRARPAASNSAYSMASIMLRALAIPRPAISKAVP